MFCDKCGNQLAESDRFCQKCGAPVQAQAPIQAPVQEPIQAQAPVQPPVQEPIQAQAPVQPPYGAPSNVPYGGAPNGNMYGNFAPQPPSKNPFGLLTVIGSIIMAIGTFLPAYTISVFGISNSLSYIEGDGVFVVILAIVSIVLAALKKEKFSFIPVAIVAILLLNLASNTSSIDSYGLVTVGFGMYLMWIGTILALASSIISLVKKN